MIDYVNSLEAKNAYMSHVVILLRLILVAPATNAANERSFSALCTDFNLHTSSILYTGTVVLRSRCVLGLS